MLWGDLENHIAQQGARSSNKKLCIFNGPIFRADDIKYRGVPVPREFWKVVAYENRDGNPGALAFVLSQEKLIKSLPEEEFEAGPYEPYQLKLRELEDKTGLDFGSLRSFDPLETEENESYFEEGTEVVPLTRLEEVVL